ncbi:hypothetical protein R70006_06266 [Paraburkholderia domus]|uniref:hypothetical protein n=1 Tax=Paraburkholderia domus TaxID=2793075 RepID=UPI001913CAC9|nr:hypothetical protein [Paraburkholderia domus]MBK5052897.1 hypothetical protein [Burkholderia sp. R-70006]CAE6822409.1 hypothetical protein R70006_06266 [Paraburkholderia domus]
MKTQFEMTQGRDCLERIQPFLPDESLAACTAVLNGRLVELDPALRLALQETIVAVQRKLTADRSIHVQEILQLATSFAQCNLPVADAAGSGRFCDCARTIFEYTFALTTAESPRH